MRTSKSHPRGIFGPNDINEMREELALGKFPGETAEEREVRAQDIVERRKFRQQSDVIGEPAARRKR